MITNESGGKQSDTPYGFQYLPPRAMFAAAQVALRGARKYGETFENRNYVKIPSEWHISHAIQHLYSFLAGDQTDNHLANAIVRCLLAYDVAQLEAEADHE